MQFSKINIQNQYNNADSAPPMNLDEFHQTFEDLKLMSEINTCVEITPSSIPEDRTKIQKFKLGDDDEIDMKLADGKNWYNPFEDNYINPKQLDPYRVTLLVLINKFTKKLLVIAPPYQTYYIPGGKPKIFESSSNSAIRNFHLNTGVKIDKNKIIQIFEKKIQISHNISINCETFLGFVFDEQLTCSKISCNKNLAWIPLKYLKSYPNRKFKNYYNSLYASIIQNLY